MPSLIVMVNGSVVRQWPLQSERTRIGRAKGCDVLLDHLSVSGSHAVLTRRGQDYAVQDLGSTNRTWLNGQALEKDAAPLLASGDVVGVGRYQVVYDTAVVALAGPVPNSAPASLLFLNGVAENRALPLGKPVMRLGKPGRATVVVEWCETMCLIRPQNSAVPILLNELPLTLETVLRHGDVIELDGTRMRFVQRSDTPVASNDGMASRFSPDPSSSLLLGRA